ncbi:MAG: ABC transporter ATP-binding protein [Actinomycetales bacterium]
MSDAGTFAVLRRGVGLSPEFLDGVGLTLLLAVVATAGRVVVPIAVQQTIDTAIRPGLQDPNGVDVAAVRLDVALAALAVVVTAVAASRMNVRLFRASESGLASLRIAAFRHVHELSTLSQNSQRRGALVSRVTSDVDTISTFLQSGGLQLIVSAGQLVVATALMAYYSWQLTVLVWVCFLPLFLLLRSFQRLVSQRYAAVRQRMGDLLGVVSETVVGAATIRAYGVEERTASRVDGAIDAHRSAMTRAQVAVGLTFSSGEVAAGLANALIVVVGVLLGLDGDLSLGRLLAFLFLVTLFIGPVQIGTEVLNEAQNAVAGWRRVLEVLDTPADVADPGPGGIELPARAIDVVFDRVSYAYPGGPLVLRDVSVTIPAGARLAVVGQTGGGKTTFAKLLMRLMDPVEGRVLVDGHDVRTVAFGSLRQRVLMVPQDGFLFDDTVGGNVRFAVPDASDDEVEAAFEQLGLGDWLATLPAGTGTRVGQRGERLSAGERQLVALARAYLADPDVLVLDEATSAVDPATEMRIARALDRLARGRTTVTIAHRLSTAESADAVLVFDAGELVQQGTHEQLVAQPGVYQGLHRSWSRQHGS